MPYCPYCAVEVDDYVTHCPLCDAPVQAECPEVRRSSPVLPTTVEAPSLPWPLLRQRIFLAVSLFILVPIVLTVVVNGIVSGRLTWSRQCIAALAVAWALTGVILYWLRRPWRLLGGGTATVLLLLLALDALAPPVAWFPTLGLPIVLLSALTAAVLVATRRWFHATALQLCAHGLAAGGIYCLLLDMLVKLYRYDTLWPGWSWTVLISVMPPAIFLLYVHHRVARHVNLRKIFHV